MINIIVTSKNIIPKPVFGPKSLTVTFESQIELDLWTSLFNSGQLAAIGIDPNARVWTALHALGGDIKPFNDGKLARLNGSFLS